MCYEFARQGLNVCLISRTQSKLDECKSQISAKYPRVKVSTLAVDYSSFDDVAKSKVSKHISDYDVGVLVNNVGISYPYTKYFHELDDERVEQLITLNIDSTTWMTRIALPGMLSRKRGSIVNISSIAGVMTSPLLAQYGAAKSYIAMFSKTLNAELSDKGIHVQCQIPLFVATKLAKIRKASITVASPSGYAKAAVRAIGYEPIVSPFWSHAAQIYIFSKLPEWLLTAVTKNMHLGIRKAGMKKDAKAKAN